MKRRSEIIALARTIRGIPLLGCPEGSPAERAGMQYGDIIIFVNGVRTRSVIDYQEAKKQAEGPMEVIFRRHGETMITTFAEPPPPTVVHDARNVEVEGFEGRWGWN
jgi:predicted metalloprotease with PDZ domain